MFSLTKDDEKVIIKYMADALTYAEEEKDIMKVAAKIFAQSFEDFDEDNGMEVARRLYDIITDFKEKKDRAVVSGDSLEATMEKCFEIFPLGAEGEEYLQAFIDGFNIFDAEGNAESFENNTAEKNMSREELKEGLSKAVTGFADNLSAILGSGTKEDKEFWWSNPKDKTEVQVLYAMAIYCAAKRNELSAVPNFVTPEICASVIAALGEIRGVDKALQDSEDGSYGGSLNYARELKKNILIFAAFFIAFVICATLMAALFANGQFVYGVSLLFASISLAIICCMAYMEVSFVYDILVENQEKRNVLKAAVTDNNAESQDVCERDRRNVTQKVYDDCYEYLS